MTLSIIDRLVREAEAISLKRAFFLVFCWVFLRIFLEGVLESQHYIGFYPLSYRMLLVYLVHFPLFYISLFLLLVIIVSLFINENPAKVTNIASVGLASIIFVPLIDYFVSRGYVITYPLRLGPYIVNFLNPFVSLTGIGVSPGQRITVVLVAFLIAVYVFLKTRSNFRACVSFVISLSAIVLFGCLTTILAANQPELVYVSGGILYTETQKYCALYMSVLPVVIFVYAFLLKNKCTRAFLSSIRMERMAFYGGMTIFGYAISVVLKGAEFGAGIFDYLGVIMMFLSMAFGYWSVQVFNDMFDADIDRVTGKRNPILSGMNPKDYRVIFFVLTILALCYALIVNFPAFLILTAFLLLGFVYSMPPVRLKRIPVISTLVIAVEVCLCIGFGFSVHYGGRAINTIPGQILVPTLIAVTLGFAAKDIGHVRGDRARGVITLAVLFYDREHLSGRAPMAGLISTSYLVYLVFIPQVTVVALLCALATFLYTIFVKKTSEVFYFIMLYAFGGYLCYTLLRFMPF